MRVESFQNTEREPKKENVQRFFEMGAEKEKTLKEKIKQFDGLVRVFIHPDFKIYSKYANLENMIDDVKKLEEAERVFKKILSSQSEHMPPMFIFEDGVDIDEFKEKEARLNEIAARVIYVIRTELADPTPLSPDRESNYRWGKIIEGEEKSQMWDWLIVEFKELGIKKILLGGLEFYVSKDVDVGHGGCLGYTMGKLKRFFDIEVSTLTWPSGRKEIKARTKQRKIES